jgi:hypothetical protein
MAVMVKKANRKIRAQAPSVGIHLPIPKERMAAQIPNQMKTIENAYSQNDPEHMWKNKSLVAWNASIASRPPTQTGFDSQ